MSILKNSKGEELRLIGKIKSAQGLKGQLFALFFSKDYDYIDDIETLYIGLDKAYEVKKIAPHKEGVILTVEGVNDRNQAEALQGEQIYLPDDFFESDSGEEMYLSEIENFKVFDTEKKYIGTITGFSFNGAQDLLIVENAELNKIYEIPFVEEFVIDIDSDKSEMTLALPEGLLEINEN